jgi:hypothetical protein
MASGRDAALAALLGVTLAGGPASAAEAEVVTMRAGRVDTALAVRIEAIVATRRTVLPLRAMPSGGASPEVVADEERQKAIAGALERARRHEEVAAFAECAREAGDELGTATEVLASSGKLDLLRDLHLQIGACMSLAGQPADAEPHFLTAALLDEAPAQTGVHREEAEAAYERARAQILARARGPVRIDSDPRGAEVWIDGKKVPGVTPLTLDVRLGTHFVTLRRFRHDAETNQALLQPGSKLRFVLAGAHRDTLREQLGAVAEGELKVPASELRLAQALWSGADELFLLARPRGPAAAIRVSLLDAETGRRIRSDTLPASADDDTLRRRVCAVLGEQCDPPAEGVSPHLIWPFAVAAAIGAAIVIGFVVDGQRETVFCPSGGC